MIQLGPMPVMESSGLGSTTVRVSPPLRSSNCWGEQRASFSDVVARNDSSPLYSSIVAPHKRTQQQQQQQQQHGSQVAATLFADTSLCSSSSSSSSCSNTGSNISRKVSDSSVPTSTSAHLGK